MVRIFAFGLVVAAVGCVVAATMTVACITEPPPDIPELPQQRPTILHESVIPPNDAILTDMPSEFIVPVVPGTPDENFFWDVFVDYTPCLDPTSCQSAVAAIQPRPSASTTDGGIVLVPFPGFPNLEDGACHRIDFLVAHQFDPGVARTWDSVGGDIVSWFYNAGGGQGGCPTYDAGALADGAFPPPEAGADGLPVTPESGSDDP